MKKTTLKNLNFFTAVIFMFIVIALLIRCSFIYIADSIKIYMVSKEFAWKGFAITIIVLIFIIVLLTLSNIKRKRAEFALRESEELLRTVINALPDIICFKDSDGRWIEANKAMLNLYNSEVSILGKTDSELSELLPHFKKEFNDCERTDKMVWERAELTMVEEAFRQPNGEARVFEVAKVPLFYEDGSRKGLVVLGREITERKRAEQIKLEAEKNERLLNELMHYDKIKTEFFANLSHELRTPLNLILGPVQLLKLMIEKNTVTDNLLKLSNYINTIQQNCYRLIRIVNNLIDITKIDAGYIDLQLQNGNIVSIIEDITLSVKDYIENKGLELIFDTDVEEKIICCDHDKIERILLNLLSNAIKFTAPGGSINVYIKDREDTIQVSVKDTGIGVPKEKHSAIFERFVQVDKSLSRNREGSGIGLSLAKSFIEMHGGKIMLNSEYGQGCEFLFTLPVKTVQENTSSTNEIFNYSNESNVEIINIEFSDIYS